MDTMNDSVLQQYNMYGWRTHFVFDAEKLNALCRRYYESEPDTVHTDAVDFVHQRPSGWLTTRCVLGSPLPEFPTGNSETISVSRRFVSYTTYEFQRAPGAQYAELIEVVAGSRNERMALFQSFRVDQCVGTYKYNDDTVFTLSGGSNFAVGFLGGTDRDTDAGLPFKLRFDNLPTDKKIVVLPKTRDVTFGRWLMQDIRFYLRGVPGQLSHVLYIANASEGNGSFPAGMNNVRNDGLLKDENLLGKCYVNNRDIPQEYYGRDFEDFSQILFPYAYVKFGDLDQGPPESTVAEVRLVDPYTMDSEASAPEAAVYSSHVNPLVRIVSAGSPGQRLVLNTVNPAEPIWRFTSQSLGRLVPDGRYCNYIPQDEGV